MLRIDGLQKSYGVRTLLDRASLQFPEGQRIALVGANGAGKTTLLNILCGLESSDAGVVHSPNHATIGYLPQKPNPNPKPTVLEEAKEGAKHISILEKELNAALQILSISPEDVHALATFEEKEAAFRLRGGYALESKAQSILRGLGFTAENFGKSPDSLSGGWRMRLELARLFLSDPDFLILDEPTNHLDLPSLIWVEHWLMNFKGTLLFVSHDRALLNRLATYTIHLHQGHLSIYRGNFDAFLEQREARQSQEQAALSQLKRKRESMEDFVQRFGAKATKASQAQSRLKMIAKIRALEGQIDENIQDYESTISIKLPAAQKTPRLVYSIERGAIGYGHILAYDIKLEIERGQKIAIIGANGIGKSTLLRTMAGRMPPSGGYFQPTPGVNTAYFSQDPREILDLNATVLNNVLRSSSLGEPAARSLLGSFLFTGESVFKNSNILSGGELSRLCLACVLAKQAGLLLLDEPTNHLDMGSVESLASALDDYDGTLLFVSHDRNFIDAVCTHIFAMLPDGRSMLFAGKLGDYDKLSTLSGFPNVLDPDFLDEKHGKSTADAREELLKTSKEPPSHAKLKEQKSVIQKHRKKIDQIEKEMSFLKEQISKTESELNTISVDDYKSAQNLHSQLVLFQTDLERQEEEWLKASEELEKLL